MKLATVSTMVALSLAAAGAALGGPNAGGYLLFHTEDSVVYTSDQASYCGQSILDCPLDFNGEPYDSEAQCQASLGLINPTSGLGSATAVAWVIAAFPSGSYPRVAGVTFGLNWDINTDLVIVGSGSCGNFELATSGWPDNRLEGTAITWSSAQRAQALEVYWFAAYSYAGSGGPDLEVQLVAHPTQGGKFADDSVPSILDVIPSQNYGSLGLNGAVGNNPYGGANPTLEKSWGEVKSIFGQ